MKTFIKYYFPILLWCFGIYFFSSIPNLKTDPGSIVGEIVIRKAGHIGEFAILFWLLWRVAFYVWKLTAGKALAISLVATSFYAGTDEWHQRFVVGRSGRVEDIVFDILSALLAMQLILIIMIKGSRKYAFLFLLMIIGIIFSMEYGMIKDGEKAKETEKEKVAALEAANSQEEATFPEEKNSEEVKENPAAAADNISNLPAKIKIDNVPFVPQAPLGNWDAYHEEACEETSVIMVKHYLDRQKLTPEGAEKEIQSMIKFEIEKYSDYKDSDAEEIVRLARDYYGLDNLRVVYDFKRQDIKKYLAEGHPIIVPAAGRLLGNPYFTAPGPLYHNLVLVGYDGDNIITNDPGTKRGQNYVYNINVLYNAIHDFPGRPEDIEKGKKAMIVVY